MGLISLFNKKSNNTSSPSEYKFLSSQELTQDILNTWQSRSLIVGLLPHLKVNAEAFVDDPNQKCYLADIKQALAHTFDSDAQMQPVYLPSVTKEQNEAWRLAKSTLKAYQCFVDLIVLDFDAKKDGKKWPWSIEDFKACVIGWQNHHILGKSLIYKTLNGLRVLIPLDAQYKLNMDLEGADWNLVYTSVLEQLPKCDLGAFDLSCTDPIKTFRLPSVIRDKQKLESCFYIPKETYVHAIDHEFLAYANVSMQHRKQGTQGLKGLVDIFKEANLYIESMNKILNGEPMHRVICPWSDKHSSNDPRSNASVLFSDGKKGFIFDCKHASCMEERKKPNALKNKFPELFEKHIKQGFEFELDTINAESICENIASVLKAEKEAPFYQKAREIVRVIFDRQLNQYRIITPTKEEIASYLDHHSKWYTFSMSKKGDFIRKYENLSIEKVINRHYHSYRDLLPILDSLTCYPPINDSFEPLIDSVGYCESQKTFFTPSPSFKSKHLHDIPTSIQDAQDAGARLLDLLTDFPLADEGQKLVALSALFTAAFRRKIDSTAPFYLVSANSPGAGKTKLISAIMSAVTGKRNTTIISPPDDETELEKRLNGLLLDSSDYIILDNITNYFGGKVMDVFLTSDIVSIRKLGKSEQTPIKMRTFLAGTGNNAVLKGDTHRRTITVRLVTQLDDPTNRKDFKHKDIESFASSQYSMIWRDLLTIQQAYLEHADKKAINEYCMSFGSFEAWADIVQKPLAWLAMILGFQDIDIITASKEHTLSRDTDELVEVFGCLKKFQDDHFASKEESALWLASDIIDAYKAKNGFNTYLDSMYEMLYGSSKVLMTTVSLAKKLNRFKDKVVQGYQFQITKGAGNKTFYCLVPVDHQEPPKKNTDLSRFLAQSSNKENVPPASSLNPIYQASMVAPIQKIERVLKYDWQSACRQSLLNDKTDTCQFIMQGGICGKDRTDCEFGLVYIEEPKQIESKPIAELKHEVTLFNIEHASPSAYTPALQSKIYNLLCIDKNQTQIADILSQEGFKTPKKDKPWSARMVGDAIKFFGISKDEAKPSSIDKKIQGRGCYDSSWPAYAPKTRISKEEYLKHYPEGTPIGGDTAGGVKVDCGATSLLSSALGVTSIQEALNKATTPEQRAIKEQMKALNK